MKNKPGKVTDVRHLSVETEHTVFDDYIRQTLKQVEGNVTAHEVARPADVRSDRHEYSVLQPAPRQRQACFRCPYRLGHGSFCCGSNRAAFFRLLSGVH